MKNILKVAAATFLLLSGTACSDFLDEDLKKELAPDNTYTSTYGFQVGVNGLWLGPFRVQHMGRRYGFAKPGLSVRSIPGGDRYRLYRS